MKFPEEFLWGAATSSHQVEGDCTQNDWWRWEQTRFAHAERRRSSRLPISQINADNVEGKNPKDFQSGKACDHYHRFEEDFDLVKSGGQNAHRISIEWSRIEPEEGKFYEKEIAHYREVLKALKARGIKAFVTLWHFTNPQWFAEKGGWLKGSNRKYFLRYCGRMAEELGGLVDAWMTVNEPGVYAQLSYHWGWWPPQVRAKMKAGRVFWNLARAHRAAYALLKRITPSVPVGIANNCSSFESYRKHHLWDHVIEWGALLFANHLFYWCSGMRTHDFLGINYYFKTRFSRARGKLMPLRDDVGRYRRETNMLGWEIHPYGLFDVLMDFSHLKKPMYITENGIATDDDAQRQQFLQAHLQEVWHAIQANADVRGYFYWSLLDNFEWAEGWRPKFGLVEVDRLTFERRPKESYDVYKQIIRESRDHEIETKDEMISIS